MSRVRYGIKNVHYALVKNTDNGTYTYDTPKPLKGAVSISYPKKQIVLKNMLIMELGIRVISYLDILDQLK